MVSKLMFLANLFQRQLLVSSRALIPSLNASRACSKLSLTRDQVDTCSKNLEICPLDSIHSSTVGINLSSLILRTASGFKVSNIETEYICPFKVAPSGLITVGS